MNKLCYFASSFDLLSVDGYYLLLAWVKHDVSSISLSHFVDMSAE